MPQICLSEETFAKVAEYATAYGMSNDRAANKAVDHWWEEVGSWSVAEARKRGIAPKRRRVRRQPITLVRRRPAVVRHIALVVNE